MMDKQGKHSTNEIQNCEKKICFKMNNFPKFFCFYYDCFLNILVQSMRRIDYLRQTNEQILRKNSVRDRSRSPISLNRSLGNAYNPKTNDDIIKCLQNKENDLKKRGTEIKNLKDEITKLKEINNKKTQEITHLRKMVEILQKCAECKDNFDVSEYLRCKNCVSKRYNLNEHKLKRILFIFNKIM